MLTAALASERHSRPRKVLKNGQFEKLLTYIQVGEMMSVIIRRYAYIGIVSVLAQSAARAREVVHEDAVDFDIHAQSLIGALKDFTEQSGLQLMMPADKADDVLTPRIVGAYTPGDALQKLLAGTSLSYEFANSHTVAIRELSAFVSERPFRDVEEIGSSARQGASSNSEEGGSDVKKAQGAIPEILVKGSRVMNVDVVRSENDVQAYTILGSKRIESSSATSVEDFLKQELTMNSSTVSNSQAANSPRGNTSSINLRGLGSNETLVLVNGRRSAGVTTSQAGNQPDQPDINGIPLSAIERIEVLPSSASAIYGGAALGGVINIVMKRDFQGGGFSYSYDNPDSANAPLKKMSGSYGISLFGGKTRLLIGGQYAETAPLVLGDRQEMLDDGVSRVVRNGPSRIYDTSFPFSGATPNISSTTVFNFSAPGCVVNGVIDPSKCRVRPNLTLKDGRPLNSPVTSVAAGTQPGQDVSSALISHAGTYNLTLASGNAQYGLQSRFGTVSRLVSFYSTLRQSIFDNTEVFLEYSKNKNQGRAEYNPFANFSVPASAPTNPFLQSVTVSAPSTVNSPFLTDSDTDSATIGLIAPIGTHWSSEFDYTWSRNAFDLAYNVVDTTAIASALRSGALNPFVDTTVYKMDLERYLVPSTYNTATSLRDFAWRVSGPVASLPGGDATLTVGLEYRKESTADADMLSTFPLNPGLNSNLLLFGQAQSTKSAYAEALVPLVAPDSIPLTHSLQLQAAVRSEMYKVFARNTYAYLAPAQATLANPPQISSEIKYTSTNPTIGLKYSPVADLSFRASYATAFLPPSAGQLLLNPISQCGGQPCNIISDPQVNQTYFVDSTGGGDPNLKPQESRSWTFGLIWEPHVDSLRGLRMNLERYMIRQPNYIAVPTPQQFATDPGLSSHVTRDSSTGLITTIAVTPVNAVEYRTAGWDFKADLEKVLKIGTLSFGLSSTFIDHDERQTQLALPFVEYAGYPNDGGEGKIKATARVGWQWNSWNLAWVSRYSSSYYQLGAPSGPSASATSVVLAAQGAYSVPYQIYHDIYTSYSFSNTPAARESFFGQLSSRLTLMLGVSNVLNTKPPFDAASFYYYSSYGDPRLRTYRISAKMDF